jgi:hypothetical protein
LAIEGTPSTCSQDQCPAEWLGSNAQIANTANCKEATRVLLYHWWNVWKERNKRVFQAEQQNEFQVATAAKEIGSYVSAFGLF